MLSVWELAVNRISSPVKTNVGERKNKLLKD
jgi:hypothetical protein